MIDRQTVARILDAARIEDVVGDFVTLKRRGVNYIGLCPFHDEKTGSFIVSPAKGIYKCFGCGKAGGAVNFIMEHEQLSYVEALRYLARKYRIEIVETELTEEERKHQSDRESMFAVNTWASNYFTDKMENTADGKAIGKSYFRERGFTDETIRKFGLGYCPDTSDHMTLDALKAGYKAEFIEKTGIGILRDNGTWYDRFRGRVMFPVHTLSGKVVAFGGRVLRKSDKTAKYVNSPESEIYHKSNELYGIYFAKQSIVKADRCILVEGYTDVISMHQSGVTNVVASSGTSLTTGQIRLIRRFTPNITVLYDGDSAGIKASIRGIDLLLEAGMNVKVVLLPDGEDPDSFAQSHDASEFIGFIDKNQVDFIHFKIKLLIQDVGNDPIRRAAMISDVTRSVALIPDNIIRSVYIHETATALDIDENVIVNEVRKILYDKRQKELAHKSNGDFSPYHYSIETQNTTPAYRNDPQNQAATPTDTQLLTSGTPQPDYDNTYDQYERNILQYLVRHGEEIIDNNTDGSTVTVAQFIIRNTDDLTPVFHNPLHMRMFEIARQTSSTGGTKFQTLFRDYQDPEISSLAAELIADRYQISRIFTKLDEYNGDPNDAKAKAEHELKMQTQHREELMRNVYTVVYEYKFAILQHSEQDINGKIEQAEKKGKQDDLPILMQELKQIKAQQNSISPYIGGRVIVGSRGK